jgi:hypothetical protein
MTTDQARIQDMKNNFKRSQQQLKTQYKRECGRERESQHQ